MRASRLFGVWVVAVMACGPIDPAPLVDEAGNPIIEPPPFDTALVATPRYAEVEGRAPVLRWQLNAYLDQGRLVDYLAVTLTSGGVAASGRVTYRMADRTLEFRPSSRLHDGLYYRPQLSAARLFSVTGSPLAGRQQPRFEVDATIPSDDPPLPSARWADVAAIFDAKCNSCHNDPTWQLTPLTREALVGGRSDQVDRQLVVPYNPGDSYLLHKVLPDYPLRRFTVQPPPWSEVAPLDLPELLTIERWIITGASE